MLERVLLDTNALLNTVFLPQSFSRQAVICLEKNKSELFIGSETLKEAVGVAQKIAVKLGKEFDPAPIINETIRCFGMLEIEPSSDTIEAAVPAHDHHVAQEAAAAKATILTSDAQLWTGCRAVGRQAVLPLQALKILKEDSLQHVAFGVPPTQRVGSVFARVYAGAWAGQKNIGQFTVTNCAGSLCLYYCTHKSAWVVEVMGVGCVTIPAEIKVAEMYALLVSWEVGKGLRLRTSSVQNPKVLTMTDPLPTDLDGGFAVGRRVDNQHYWYGVIGAVVIDNRTVSKKLWQMFRDSSELTPDPYDKDRLEQAIRDFIR